MTPDQRRDRILMEARFIGWAIEERFPDSPPTTPRTTRRVVRLIISTIILTILYYLTEGPT